MPHLLMTDPQSTGKSRWLLQSRLPRLLLVLAALGLPGSALLTQEAQAAPPGVWSTTGTMSTARQTHTATGLQNGKVLVAGGQTAVPALASAELYDPSTGNWSTTGSLLVARDAHTATVLSNGKVLVAGGNSNGTYLASAELYDPATGTWSATGAMAAPRYNHVATILPSGKVLVAGGANSSSYLASAEVYDPVAGTWSTTGAMAYHHGGGHTATVLTNGKILVAGGSSNDLPGAFGISRGAELFDPVAGTWSSTGSMATPRYAHSSTLLSSGKAIVAGGTNNSGALVSAELYDSNTSTWSTASSLAVARSAHTATLLPDGNVLVAGGYNNISGPVASNELYDPSAGTWSNTGVLATARNGQTATFLITGKVMVAGGVNSSNNSLASAELYDPSPALAPPPPPGGTNLFVAMVNGGASGQVEVHGLSQQSHYTQFMAHAASAFAATNTADWQFLVAPFNGDGQPDLYGIHLRNTASGMVEVHAVSAASGYRNFIVHAATPFQAVPAGRFQFALGSFAGDGHSNLYAIILNNTGSGGVEVHVLSEVSNYATWLLHSASALGSADASVWQFRIADRFGSGDLVGILHGTATGSGRTEVHALSRSSGYQAFTIHAATPLGPTTDSQWAYAIGDHDADHVPDIYAVLMNGGASGRTEVHVLSGAIGYTNWNEQAASGLGPTDATRWQFSTH